MGEQFYLESFLADSIARKQADQTLVQQISDGLRESILLGRMRAGDRLPSSRQLASTLKVSRNTITSAFERLTDEGYLRSRRGAGSFVAEELPDDLLQARVSHHTARHENTASRRIAARATRLDGLSLSFSPASDKPRAFQTGFSAVDEFPIETWTRMFSRRLRRLPRKALDYAEPGGYLPLRQAVANHLRVSRGVSAEPSQVFITAGSQQALDAAFRTLLDEGDDAVIEDPNYIGARGALLAAGARLIPLPVDKEGIEIAQAKELAPNAKLAYVTPSHQFPLGVVMSLSRRLELLEWANRNSAWIVEDDYDSEFRYRGGALAALQGLDNSDRVIYIGTFSKVLFPSLRLGYMVVPEDLTEAFERTLTFMSYHTSVIEQAVLADFIDGGHFGRHVRRMRVVYAERQNVLISEIGEHLGSMADAQNNSAGMHLIAWLKGGLNAKALSGEAGKVGVYVSPLSFHCMTARLPEGLLMGYTGISSTEIRRGIAKLAKLVTPQ